LEVGGLSRTDWCAGVGSPLAQMSQGPEHVEGRRDHQSRATFLRMAAASVALISGHHSPLAGGGKVSACVGTPHWPRRGVRLQLLDRLRAVEAFAEKNAVEVLDPFDLRRG